MRIIKFKFESGRAGIEYSGPPSAGHPPESSVLSDRPTACLPLAAGLPARAPRALVLSEWEAGVSILASQKEIPRTTVWDITIHTAGVAIGRLGPVKDLK